MPPLEATLDRIRTLLDQADAFLIDYNGTLSHDEELCAELIDGVARDRLGLPVSRERYFSEFVGVTEEAVYARLVDEVGGSGHTPHDLFLEFNRRYLDRFRESSTITPGAAEFVRLAHARGKRLVLVTAASREVVVPVLEISGLGECFEGVIGLEDVATSKPRPDCYLLAVERLGLEKSQTVAFEDSRTGLTAATAAEVPTVAILGSLEPGAITAFTPHMIDGLNPDLLGA